MFLRRLAMRNYGVFENAEFNLNTTPDKPLILITANNGGGKTSTLTAFRLALHGRRAFDVPISEREYVEAMHVRFHNGNIQQPCSLELDFDFVDYHSTRHVSVIRQWATRKKQIVEDLEVSVDGKILAREQSEDLLTTAVPPEIARYFFFDGERIRELADWDADSEVALFEAVSDLLGVQLIDQLVRDLTRIQGNMSRSSSGQRDISGELAEARSNAKLAHEAYSLERSRGRRIRGAYDRARLSLRRLGVLYADELNEVRDQLSASKTEYDFLVEEASRIAHDILPLLCGRRLRRQLGVELERRRHLEEREIVQRFFDENSSKLLTEFRKQGFRLTDSRSILEIVGSITQGKPVVVDHHLPSISRPEAAWMQRVVERELPELETRARDMLDRMRGLEQEIRDLDARLQAAPQGDPKGESALSDLEKAHRELVEHESSLSALELKKTVSAESLEALEKQARAERLAEFQGRRLATRDRLLSRLAAALPMLSERLETSKETRFAEYLLASLKTLWHKRNRLNRVDVSFANRRIDLLGPDGVLNKNDLSSGEKQLFATAFIYSLARLSGRHMPFVIDTPLGRLDHEHRRRFVSGFLPDASHQTILLSTDTEIVGRLHKNIEHLFAHHYELSDYNGRVTTPVDLAVAT